MRKLFYISLVLATALIVWLLAKQGAPKATQPQPTNMVVELPPRQLETNPVENTPNAFSRETVSQRTNTIEPTVLLANALTTTNIEQWKAAIKGLHKMPGLSESWDMEMKNLTSSVPVNLEESGQAISYKAQFIDISVKNGSGDILEAQLHSPIMNIDETRELGLQLCNMLEIDPKDFLAWCDKVGNHWLDSPLFSSGGSRISKETLI
ncbi:MAG TPA: hypothetical protein VIK35_07710 [Verrucomicrobiae bacterium]